MNYLIGDQSYIVILLLVVIIVVPFVSYLSLGIQQLTGNDHAERRTPSGILFTLLSLVYVIVGFFALYQYYMLIVSFR